MPENAEDRAQTAIDFAIGIALFLLAVAFVLAFVPSMFAPFFIADGGNAMVADRSAAYLVENKFVDDAGTPGALNETAVASMLNHTDCNDDPGAHLADKLSTGTQSINVTIEGPTNWYCGENPSGSQTVSTRIVTIEGEQHTLRVVVW